MLGLIELAAPNARIDYFAVQQLNTPVVQILYQPHWQRQSSAIAIRIFCSDELAVAAAMKHVAQEIVSLGSSHGNRYLNLSLGTFLPPSLSGASHPGIAPLTIQIALAAAKTHNVEVVAAAGNDIRPTTPGGNPLEFYPACLPDVIAIGASDSLGDPIMWSHGDRFYRREAWWDYLAPG